MIYIDARTNIFIDWDFPLSNALCALGLVLVACLTIFSQTAITLHPDEKTVIIEDAPEMEVFSFGKTVIIKKEAKGVFSFGGNVIVEGRVSGDVATIGGTIIQQENAFIGGAVIAFGGSYKPESKNPLRNPDMETMMYAGFEEEIRDLTQNPGQIFSPRFSWAFLTQRLLAVPFWFIISFVFTTIAPGAISRAIARFQLSTVKIIAVGFASFIVTILGVMASLLFLPNYINALVGLMLFVFLILAYVFGRVTLQISVGKQLQKRFLPEAKQSETLAILIGVVFWTVFLSIPYILAITLLILLSASIGLILSARSPVGWQKQ